MNEHANKLESTGLLAGLVSLLCLPCLLVPLLIALGLSSLPAFGSLGVALVITALITACAIRQRDKAYCDDCIVRPRRKAQDADDTI